MADSDASRQLRAMADLLTPMTIRIAATLGIADRIAAGMATAVDLAAATGVRSDPLARLLRHLVTKGVLDVDRHGVYALTELGQQLRADAAGNLRTRFDIDGALGRADLALVHLMHSIRTGEVAFPLLYGRGFWEDLRSDPDRTAAYDQQMGIDVSRDAEEIIGGFDWGSLGTIVDVGGGDGTLLVALLRAFPQLRGVLFDQPGTAEAARRRIAHAGLDARASVVGGSFFDSVPSGAAGYLLCAILHDWDDDSAIRILQRTADAAGPDGRVFIVEKVGEDGETLRTSMNLLMLAWFGGKERGVGELRSLSERAGLTVVAVHPAGESQILELRGR